ncbi:NAD-dependent epimerase/dehydratase family protein [Pseudotenacibaculum sp. MALMAid0570]|uniref:NAD-dependent epimerase/dehydratase family protein n=1 Tax=Pseudotenacibaculum sp. MALMAid0570 TaxID=3143938 RepID=UPI0032DF5EDB
MSNTNKSRRKFIKNSLLFGISIPLIGQGLYSCVSNNDSKKLKILILGGTSFLGPHQIAYAISRGHSVTTFTRGKTKSTIHKELFSQVEQLIGDREDNLTALKNRSWDVIIDNSGRKTEWTKKTANLLKEKSGIYLYISSTGVHFPYLKAGLNEESEVALSVPETLPKDYMKMSYDYGVMKATSELEAQKAFGKDRTIVVRPTYMFGPGDLTNRFIHWPIRLAKEGEILVPGRKEDPVQYIDVRDVAEWCIRLAENKAAGTYAAVGPAQKETIQDFAKKAQKTFDIQNELVFVDDYKFLEENGVYYIVPWILEDEYGYGSARIDNTKAKENGLTFRNLNTSIKETHDWWYSDALTQELRDKFEKNSRGVYAREQELLKKWKELNS